MKRRHPLATEHRIRQEARARDSGAPGKLRIIGGSLRNSKLQVIDAQGLRPTPERVRETLFNWLQPVVSGSRCLDLFAGTGALGLEAVSRGAREVVLVEQDPRLARAIAADLVRLKIGNAQVQARDAESFLSGAASPFDVVFLDPPFDSELWSPVAARLEDAGWLGTDAWIYVESPRTRVPELPRSWAQWREGHAGEVRYALYRRS